MSEYIELQEVEIFSDLTPAEIDTVSANLRPLELEKDTILFNEGDEGRELFVVRSGILAASVKTQDGTDLDIVEFEAGDFFGEMSIFEQEPRSATCYTKSQSLLQSLHESDLHRLIETEPTLAMKIMLRMLTITRNRLDNTGSFLTEMVQWGEAARKRSITDELTGFFNRRYLDESLPSLVQTARDTEKPFCICMLDLDHFRQINEQISHAVGDEAIQKAVGILHDVLVDSDIPVRYGGDEFVILMPGTMPEDAAKRAEAVRKEVSALDILTGYECTIKQVTTSIGIACFPYHAKDVGSLKEAADRALYRAKEEGRNMVFVYTEGE